MYAPFQLASPLQRFQKSLEAIDLKILFFLFISVQSANPNMSNETCLEDHSMNSTSAVQATDVLSSEADTFCPEELQCKLTRQKMETR